MAKDAYPLAMQRNEDLQRTFTLRDTDDISDEHPLGRPIDLTGHTFAGAISQAAGDADYVLEIATQTAPLITGLRIVAPPTAGQVVLTILRSDLEAGAAATTPPVGNAMGVVTLAYDILWTTPTGLVTRFLRGPFTYEPGVTP
jgi:hypothetical protein